ncbi:MAG TPA: tryptophan synthase subunit alpha [Terriglobales bacterium]|nr:tryptophan synthase subunit alpha [Terriglobales bacterium]
MSRIEATFRALRARNERALVTFCMAGDPSLDVTERLVQEMDARGADVIELGVPFSDPIGDGPVNQRAADRALAAGTSFIRVLETVARIRARVKAPIVLMGYYNNVHAFGLKAFARTAADAGVDGAIIVDLPPEEAAELAAEAEVVGLDLVYLVAPTSTPPRLRLIGRKSRGFIYLVSRMGVTGESASLPPELGAQVRALRMVTTKPICVGFGISKPEQVAQVGALADGAVVGSAIVRMIEERGRAASLVDEVGAFVAGLKAPLRP